MDSDFFWAGRGCARVCDSDGCLGWLGWAGVGSVRGPGVRSGEWPWGLAGGSGRWIHWWEGVSVSGWLAGSLPCWLAAGCLTDCLSLAG